jgi:hypothetical protein
VTLSSKYVNLKTFDRDRMESLKIRSSLRQCAGGIYRRICHHCFGLLQIKDGACWALLAGCYEVLLVLFRGYLQYVVLVLGLLFEVCRLILKWFKASLH